VSALEFAVLDARAEAHAAVPTLVLRVHIRETTGAVVHAVALKCQIRIEPQRRAYAPDEEARLYDLFGEVPQWGDSVRPFLWTHVDTVLTGFRDETAIDLPVPCAYDLEVAGARYLEALGDGDVPLLLLFSGTVFTKGELGFSAEMIAWDRDATFRMPVPVWRSVMDQYYPCSGWLRLHRDTLDGLRRFKSTRGLATWDQTIERLLEVAGVAGDGARPA
jgi:hypothetical protein